jgi:hypothetical protein
LPEVPIIIPLVVAGAFLGSVWKNKELMMVRKKAVLASTISGVLNAVYALLLGFIGSSASTSRTSIPATIPASSVSGTMASANYGITFIAASGLTGFFVVLAVFFSAVGMIWYRRRKEIEPTE